MNDVTTQNQPGTTPWERRNEIGFLNAVIETTKLVLFKPTEFFENLSVQPSVKEPYLFYLLVTSVATGISLIMGRILHTQPPSKPGDGFFILVTVFAGIFIYAGLLHLFTRLFGGKGTVQETLYIAAYSSATNVFGIIPYVGSLIGTIWSLTVLTVGCRIRHKMTTVKAAMAVLVLPFLIMLYTTYLTYQQRALQKKVQDQASYLGDKASTPPAKPQ